MSADRRDRVLILRILPEKLRDIVKSKIAVIEQTQIITNKAKGFDVKTLAGGVSCRSKDNSSTLWEFTCDNKTYPARLANLPLPVEIHKTSDHAKYYKAVDIGQIMIVYENEEEMQRHEDATSNLKESFPSYYHSGITPPMTKVVERRFAVREHSNIPPPRSDVVKVEKELVNLIAKLTAKEKSKGRGSSTTTKVVEEVEDEIVDYEPWMDDYGNVPNGIEFKDDDEIAKEHPEIYLAPHVVRQLAEQAMKDNQKRKKTPSSSTSSNIIDPSLSAKTTKPTAKKKGIAARQNTPTDEMTAAAQEMLVNKDDIMANLEEDDMFDFNFNGEDDIEGLV